MARSVFVFLLLCVLCLGQDVSVTCIHRTILGNGEEVFKSPWFVKVENPGAKAVDVRMTLDMRQTFKSIVHCERRETVPPGEMRILDATSPWPAAPLESRMKGVEQSLYARFERIGLSVFADGKRVHRVDDDEVLGGFTLQYMMTPAVGARLNSGNGRDAMLEVCRADLDDWPDDARLYAGYDAVWMTPDEYSRLTPSAQAALEQYQLLGGTLVLCKLPADSGAMTVRRLDDVVAMQKSVGLGGRLELADGPMFIRLLSGKATLANAGDRERLKAIRLQGKRPEINVAEMPDLGGGLTSEHVMLICLALIVVLFVLGPGVLLAYRKKCPVKIFVATPVLSLAVCAAAFLIWLAAAGFKDGAVARGIAFLDQGTGRCASIALVGCPPSAMGRERLSTAISPKVEVYDAVDICQASIGDVEDKAGMEGTLERQGLDKTVHYGVYAFGTCEERLEVSFEDGVCLVENRLGTDVESLVVAGRDGYWYKAGRIAAGGKMRCTRQERLAGQAAETVAVGAVRVVMDDTEGSLDYLASAGFLAAGRYACLVKDGVCVDTGRRMSPGALRVLLMGNY